MPSRVIREGLLDSQRYWSVAIEARQLFWHLMLVADDFGLMSLAPIFIRRRCFVDAPSDEKLDKLIAELHDADLLRVYEVEAARYGFIPRFQQTLRTDKAKCPMPPAQLFQDDRRAVEKFQRNKEIFKQMHSIGTASAQQPQRSRVPEVEVEGKRKEVEVNAEGTAAQQERTSGTLSPLGSKPLEELAQERGMVQRPGESTTEFRQRVVRRVMDDWKG